MTTEAPAFTILVVDDEKDHRELVATLFEMEGCDVLQAEDAPSALKLLSERQVDAIITDYLMPTNSDDDPQTGVEMMAAYLKARTENETRPMPLVILLTGFGDLLPGEDGDYGVDAIIEKPVDRQVLTRWVLTRLSG